jgi:hypothetical protein
MKMTDIKFKLSLEMEDYKRNFALMADNQEELAEQIEKNKKAHSDAAKQRDDEIQGVEAAVKSLHREADRMTLTSMEKVRGLINHYAEFKQHLAAQGGAKELVSTVMPNQLDGLAGGLSRLKGSILAELPAGGLIGLMLYGAFKKEEIQAQTVTFMRMFEQAGRVGSTEMQKIGGEAVKVGLALGKGPLGLQSEYAAMAAAFAAAGVTSKEVARDSFMGPLAKVSESITTTSFRIDSMFKLAAGTAAREASTMMKNFGMDADSATELFAKMGFAANATNQNIMAFTQSVQASGAALRSQRINLSEVAEAQLKVQASVAGIAPGKTDADRSRWAGGYAEQGTQQITQSIAGMSMGMSAVLGEMMKKSGALTTNTDSSLETMFRFKEGILNDQRKPEDTTYVTSAIKTAVELAKKSAGPDEYAQRLFLMKTMGVGYEGSRGMLAIDKAASGPELDKALKDNIGHLQKALISREDETSKFQKALLEAQWGIAKIGMGVLGLILSGIMSIIETVKWAYYSWKGNTHEAGDAEAAMRFYSNKSTIGMTNVDEGIKSSGKALEGALGGFGFYKRPEHSEETNRSIQNEKNEKKRGKQDRIEAIDTAVKVWDSPIKSMLDLLGEKIDLDKEPVLRQNRKVAPDNEPIQNVGAEHASVRPGRSLTITVYEDISGDKAKRTSDDGTIS